MELRSYPTVFQLGHKAIADIFNGAVSVEEKVDGSQFSFGLLDGELVCRSKGKQQLIDAPDKMFSLAIENIKKMDLHPEWIYRCEYLQKPKHNVLVYSRVPKQNLILFDINTGLEEYMSYGDLKIEAERLGLDVVPLLYQGVVKDYSQFREFLSLESVLGGCTVEGVVVKNYDVFTMEKKVAMGKYVNESFKEKHAEEWGSNKGSGKDMVQKLIEVYKTEARWQKAVQHLRENGELENSPKDIGKLIKEIPNDILKECTEEIKEFCFKYIISDLKRGVVRGFPEWYKEQLAKGVFEENESN
jgi:hypothetical protein